MTLELEAVRRFAAALDDALYDCDCQDRFPVKTYLDADAVLNCIAGLTYAPGQQLPDLHDFRLAVHALVMSGAAGSISLLKPHLLEFDRVLRGWPRPPGPRHEYQAELLRQLARHWGLEEFSSALVAAARQKRKATRRRQLLSLLQQHAFAAFIKAELCYGGNWAERLRRVLHLGIFAFGEAHLEDRFDLSDDLVSLFSKQLDESRADTPLNNLLDGAALASLSRMASVSQEVQIRFYTETVAVQQLFGSEVGRTLLTQRAGDLKRSILRTSEYFVIRSAFPGLSWTKRDRAQFAELASLATSLNSVLSQIPEADELGVRLALRQFAIGDRPLDRVIEQFCELQFVGALVFKEHFADELEVLLPGVLEVFQDADVRVEAQRDLDAAVEKVTDELREQLRHLRRWERRFAVLLRALRDRQRQLAGAVPQLNTDMGLGRWGLELRLKDPSAIQESVRTVVDGNATDLCLLAGYLAQGVDATDLTAGAAEHVLVLLWLVQLTEVIAERWSSWQVIQDLDPDFAILSFVGRVKRQRKTEAGGQVNWRTVRAVVARARSFATSGSRDRRPFRLMGLAHVLYWALRTWGDGRSTSYSSPLPLHDRMHSKNDLGPGRRALIRWSEESFDAAWTAASLFDPRSLGRAFALNHCAYIGHWCRIRLDLTRQAYLTLNRELQRFRSHYRFADTLALPYTQRALAVLAGMRDIRSSDAYRSRSTACDALAQARVLLAAARPYFGDEEVIAHVGEVEYLYHELDCKPRVLVHAKRTG